MVKTVSKVVGRSEKQIRESKVELGDLGLVMAESKGTIKTLNSFFIKKKQRKITVFKLIF